MKRAPSLFDVTDAAAEAAADARADADVSNGRLINHNAVKRWLVFLRSNSPLPRQGIGD